MFGRKKKRESRASRAGDAVDGVSEAADGCGCDLFILATVFVAGAPLLLIW
jgi:hypothetical protein